MPNKIYLTRIEPGHFLSDPALGEALHLRPLDTRGHGAQHRRGEIEAGRHSLKLISRLNFLELFLARNSKICTTFNFTERRRKRRQ